MALGIPWPLLLSSSELPLLVPPGSALVLAQCIGASVLLLDFTLEHPHGLAFPQLRLCLLLVYLNFFLSFLFPGSRVSFIDTSFRNLSASCKC